MAEFFFSLLIRGIILGIDTIGSNPPPTLDIVGTGFGTGVANVCIVHIFGSKPDPDETIGFGFASVNCAGDENFYELPNYLPTGINPISDDRIGDISINFVDISSAHLSDFTFPGGVVFGSGAYATKTCGGGSCDTSQAIRLSVVSNAHEGSGPGTKTTDCNGNDVTLVMATNSGETAHPTSGPIAKMLPGYTTQTTPYGFKHTAEMPDGTWYHVGLPHIGEAIGCAA